MELTNNLINQNHILCFDSYYAYLDVVKELTRRRIGCIGTLNKARTFLPEAIKSPVRNMNRGDTVFRRSGNILALVHKDKNFIRLISTVHGIQLGAGGRPNALRDYNTWTRGVDLSNQLISSYHNDHKTIKWYKTLALSFLETSIANAYILYKIRNPFTAVKQLNFRESLVMDLLPNNIDNSQPIQRLISNMHQIGKRD